MNYYEGLLFEHLQDKAGVQILEDCGDYVNQLMAKFSFVDNFIDWQRHSHTHMNLLLPFDNFDSESQLLAAINGHIRSILSKNIAHKPPIIYLNDNCFNQAVRFNDFATLDRYIEILTDNFTQRGYYMDEQANWCLCLREHSIIDFVFAT